MIIGLVGAFLTTAYMTRATYLTFFGEPRGAAAHFVHGDHGAAHDDHARRCATTTHGARTTPTRPSRLTRRPLPFAADRLAVADHGAAVDPRSVLASSPATSTPRRSRSEVLRALDRVGDRRANCRTAPTFKWVNALPSIVLVAAGFVVSLAVCKQIYGTADSHAEGPHPSAIAVLGAGYHVPGQQVLPRRPLREGHRPRASPTRSPRPPTGSTSTSSTASSTRVGIGGRKTGDWVYSNVDQRVVDGAVNGSGTVARGTGGALQPVQSGKVSHVRSAAVRRRSSRRARTRHRQQLEEPMEVTPRPTMAAQRRHLPAAGRRAGDAVHPRRGKSR